MNKNSIYIIIVTFNGLPWIDKCLSSIPKNHSVIVVDNNSNDLTVQFIEANFPDLILIKRQTNLGFGQANNIGISYAMKQGAEYVFLMNQDVYLHKYSIKNLIKKFNKNNNYGLLSPIHLNGLGNKLDQNFSLYTSPKKNIKFNSDIILQKPKIIYDFSFINAAAWLIPTSVFEKIGGFDPIFFHYQEDNNFCQRLIYHGYKIGVVIDSFVNHDRESRISDLPRENISKEVEKLNNKLRVRYANINYKLSKKDKIFEKRSLSIRLIKASLLFQIDKIKILINHYLMIDSIFIEIIRSRKININIGKHYLE